jgi:hypothetical protein
VRKLKAVVIGASGIGKHHAKWLHKEGCDVVAFVGTTEESVHHTAEVLHDLFGFEGRGYTSVEELFENETPALVSIASPPEVHEEHLRACLSHRTHVMCEKPLMWHDDVAPKEMVLRALNVAEAIDNAALVGAINTQYVAALEPYYHMCDKAGIERVAARTLFMQMDSRGAKGAVEHEEIWRDLGSHSVSVMMGFCGYGRIDHKSLEVTSTAGEFNAKFSYVPETGPACDCHLRCCNVPKGPLVRLMGINDHIMDYEGRNDEHGVYRAFCTVEGEEVWWDDFVHISFRRFVAAVRGEERPLATLQDGWANLGFQLEILHAAKRT